MNADYSLNEEAYHAYSPVYLSTTSILSYGLSYAAITSIIVYTILNHRDVIWDSMKATVNRGSGQQEDVHAKV